MVLARIRDVDPEQAVKAERRGLVGGRDPDRLELGHTETILGSDGYQRKDETGATGLEPATSGVTVGRRGLLLFAEGRARRYPAGTVAGRKSELPGDALYSRGMPTRQTNMRLGDADRARLDRLADERGVSPSEVVRHVVAEADDTPLPGPPDRDELLRLLGERAREGSVRAIELLLMRTWERRSSEPPSPPQAAPDDPFREVDLLRARAERPRAR